MKDFYRSTEVVNWIRNTFEISHPRHKSILSMEGIRGFAVFLVFLVHYVSLVNPWLSESTATYRISVHTQSIGNVGVDLFFVLSGYLIYGMLIRKERPFGDYMMRRIQRIYPTFTAVFVLYLLLSALFPSESKIPGGLEGVLFIVQNFLLLPGLFDIEAIITVAWSLSYEFFYYLLIPLVIGALRLRSWNWKYRTGLFSAVTVLLFSCFAVFDGHIRLLMFISGILLFEVTETGKTKAIPPVGIPALVLAIASVILLNQLQMNGWWSQAILFVLFSVFCLDCFVANGAATRLFSFSPMRWLGNMSYSYYLIHGLSLKFLFLALAIVYPPQNADVLLFWIGMPLAFAFTLIPSAMLFIWVERPFSLDIRPTGVLAGKPQS